MNSMTPTSRSSPLESDSRGELGQPRTIMSKWWCSASEALRIALVQKKQPGSAKSTPIPSPTPRPDLCFEALLEAEETQLERVDYIQRDAKMAWVLEQQWPVSDPDALLEEYFNRVRETRLEKVKRALKPEKKHRFADRYEPFENYKPQRFEGIRSTSRKALKNSLPTKLLQKLKKSEPDCVDLPEVDVGPWDSISMRED